MVKIDPIELSKTVEIIKKSRMKQKNEIENEKLSEQMTEDKLSEIAKPLTQPVIETLEARLPVLPPPSNNLKSLPYNLNYGDKEDKMYFLPQIQPSTSDDQQIVDDETSPLRARSNSDSQTMETPLSRKFKTMNYNPDKDLDVEILEFYKLPLPSNLIKLHDPRKLTEEYINFINKKNQVWGGTKARTAKESTDYKVLTRKIDAFKKYRDRLKLILNSLDLKTGHGILSTSEIKSSCKKQNQNDNTHRDNHSTYRPSYKYYQSPDELINRLDILIGERQLGNDSIEMINEIDSILDELIKHNVINQDDYKLLHNKWC